MDSHVTSDPDAVPLGTCMELALQQLGLAYRVKEGVMRFIAAGSEEDLSPPLKPQDKAERVN